MDLKITFPLSLSQNQLQRMHHHAAHRQLAEYRAGIRVVLIGMNALVRVVAAPWPSINHTLNKQKRCVHEDGNRLCGAHADYACGRGQHRCGKHATLGAMPTRRSILVTRFGRELDHGNLVGGCKPLVDALVQEGVIFDDSPAWLEATYAQGKGRGNPRTEVVVTIPGEQP